MQPSSNQEPLDESHYSSDFSTIVNFQIGNYFHSTTKGTLTIYDSRLKNLVFGANNYSTAQTIEIDRDGKYFDKILNFFRDRAVPLPEKKENLMELLEEAEYYQVEPLIDDIKAKLSSIELEESGMNMNHKIFLIMSSEADDSYEECSLPEIRLTIECLDSKLFVESMLNKFAEQMDSLDILLDAYSESTRRGIILTKHYSTRQLDRPAWKWSFFLNGEVLGNITEENESDFNRMLPLFLDSYKAISDERKLSVKLPRDQNTKIEGNPKDHIMLNVGGRKFDLTRECLTNYESMLRAMFSGVHNNPDDSEGYIRIDRSGSHFEKIRGFLLSEEILLPTDEEELGELLAEAQFYQITKLVNLIEERLAWVRRQTPKYSCKVFMIKSDEDRDLWKNSKRPTVKLVIQSLIDAYNQDSLGGHANKIAIWRHLLHFERFCCFTNGKVQFVKETKKSLCCLWTFTIDGEVVQEHDFITEGECHFKHYEMHENMIKFLEKLVI